MDFEYKVPLEKVRAFRAIAAIGMASLKAEHNPSAVKEFIDDAGHKAVEVTPSFGQVLSLMGATGAV